MARQVITDAQGRIAPIYGKNGALIGLAATDAGITLGRPYAVPGGALPDGRLPLTITLPAGTDKRFQLWCPETRAMLQMERGVQYVRASDLGYTADDTVILAMGRTITLAGAYSGWIPVLLIWREALVVPTYDPVTVVTPGTMETTGQVGAPVTARSPVHGGDVSATSADMETSTDAGLTWTLVEGLYATVPNAVGTRLRIRFGAQGLNGAGVVVWHYHRTAAVTIAAATVPALEEDDVEIGASVYRPAGQTTTFSPEVTFPGLSTFHTMQFCTEVTQTNWYAVTEKAGSPGVYLLQNNAAGNFSVGDGKLDDLAFRYSLAASPSVFSSTSPRFEVGAPADPMDPLKAIFNPPLAVVRDAGNGPLFVYRVTTKGDGTQGNGEGGSGPPAYGKLGPYLNAMSVWAGNDYSIAVPGNANKNVKDRVVDQLLLWADDAGLSAPATRSGYNGQHEVACYGTIALAAMTPAIWNDPRLNPAGDRFKRRLRLIMIGGAISNMWIASDDNPFPYGFGKGNARTIRGYSAGRQNAPNFSLPPCCVPYMIKEFLLRTYGEDLQTLCNAWTRAGFMAELDAVGGLLDMKKTFRQEWTAAFQVAEYGLPNNAFGPGPSEAQLKAAINGGGSGVYRAFGLTLNDHTAMYRRELERWFNRVVQPGIKNVRRNNDGTGAFVGVFGTGVWAGDRYGIDVADGPQTAGELRACLGLPTNLGNFQNAAGRGTGATILTAWPGLPNPNALGRHNELDTTDGGEARGPNRRCSMTYAISGLFAGMMLVNQMMIYGKINPADATWNVAKARWQVGILDILYLTKHGLRSYAKGGIDSDNNADWHEAYARYLGVKMPVFKGMMDLMADFWGFDPFPITVT